MAKAMKLNDVKRHTKRDMTYEEACKLANPGDPFLRNMSIALSLSVHLNTTEDWLRLQAALIILQHKKEQARCRKLSLTSRTTP